MDHSPPVIFHRQRAAAKWVRSRHRLARGSSATYLFDTIADDLQDRFEFMRFVPKSALLIENTKSRLKTALEAQGTKVQVELLGEYDEELPGSPQTFDLIVHFLGLGMVNDLPGALIHSRNTLTDDGVFIAAFPGAGSLPKLRSIALAADAEKPAARIHPQIDNRAATGLLERAGFKRQVVDSFPIQVRFSTFETMVSDLRDHGLTASLQSAAPVFTKSARLRALEAFEALREDDGKVTETFEILVLTGWR